MKTGSYLIHYLLVKVCKERGVTLHILTNQFYLYNPNEVYCKFRKKIKIALPYSTFSQSL